jgi:hypothetical protein
MEEGMALLLEGLGLASLWLPIVVAAVAVFVASSLVWMVLPYHRTDWKRVGNEDAFLDAVRAQKLDAGMYMYPGCTPADWKTPEGKARFEKGPWGTLVVLPGKPNMGRSLPRWFVFLLVISACVAYVLGHFVPAGGDGSTVFRFASTMAFVVYAGSAVPGSIWEGKPASFALKGIVDGLIYGLVTGAIFGWLWPHAA